MKDAKRIIAAMMSAGMMVTGSQSFTSAAMPMNSGYETQSHDYSYKEIMEMTDEEFTRMYYVPGYGDDTMTNDAKYRALLCEGEPGNLPETYTVIEKYRIGQSLPYLTFYAEKDAVLDPDFDPADFGFPSDWTVKLVDEIYDSSDGMRRMKKEYRVYVPVELMITYESFVREMAGEEYLSNEELNDAYKKYGIRYAGGTIDQFLARGTSIGKKGDANHDGQINVADAVAVLQYIANNEKYPLDDSGRILADIDGEAGITGGDAIAIQKIDAETWDF